MAQTTLTRSSSKASEWSRIYVRQDVKNALPAERSPSKSSGGEGLREGFFRLAEAGIGEAGRNGACTFKAGAGPSLSRRVRNNCWVTSIRPFTFSNVDSRVRTRSSIMLECDMGVESLVGGRRGGLRRVMCAKARNPMEFRTVCGLHDVSMDQLSKGILFYCKGNCGRVESEAEHERNTKCCAVLAGD